MAEPSRYLPSRVPEDLFRVITDLAEAETGENVSMIVRKLLVEALDARAGRGHPPRQERPAIPQEPAVTAVVKATRPAKPARQISKADELRILRENRFPRESRQG